MPRRGSCWATCRDCGTRQVIPWKDFARAAPPRCVACGGLVDPSREKQDLAARGRARWNASREQGSA